MPSSLWGGRKPTARQDWDYYGYGPDLPPLPSPPTLSDAEYEAQRRQGIWIISVEVALVVAAAVTVGIITKSPGAAFVAALVVPCLVTAVTLVAGSLLGVRRLSHHSLPAEPAGSGHTADDRPDDQGQPVVQRH